MKASYLNDVVLNSIPGGTVSILIGADVPELFCMNRFKRGPPGTPIAVETPVGWSLLGPFLSPSYATNFCNVNFVQLQRCNNVEELVNQLWNADFQTGTSVFEAPLSSEDREAYEKLNSSVCVTDDGHYQLPLLWQNDETRLPNNITMAQRRLASLKKRLLKDPSLKEKYVSAINAYLAKGHAKQISEDQESEITWYLPHHPVVHPHKSKIRVVFDCAAEYHNTSLNQKLVCGPDLMNNLIDVLTKFRKEPNSTCGRCGTDVPSGVCKSCEHREALRFLWWPNGNLANEPAAYQMLVHIFGAKSSPSCANFCLLQTANEFGHLYPPSISEIVHKNFYVDDCLVSLPSVDEAITIQKNLCDLLAKRGFRLRKWISNNDDVLNSIPDSEKSTSTLGHALEDSTKERLLGMLWKLKEDNFTFEVNLPQRPLTRRGILSALSSLYDPLGFVAPVVLEGRLILQSLCKRKAEWDEEITSHEAEKWLEWTSCLPAISNLNIPRCLYSSGLSQAKSLEIHNFCDASSFAYGACSYLKIVDKNDISLYSFLMGKARLAPIKTVSIPRLELTAAVLSVRLNAAMKRALNIEYCVSKFWTDSMAMLHCIQNKSKRFPTFVANRLTIIEQNSNTADWHHIPTEMNPADIASRGASANSTKGLQAWLDGPEFLKDSSCLQVKNDLFDYEPPSDFQPLRKQEVYSCVKLETTDVIDKLIARCSTLVKLKRLVVWIQRFIIYFTCLISGNKISVKRNISVTELDLAEIALIKYLQMKYFPNFFTARNEKERLNSIPVSLQKLRPFVHEGLLRVGGRLGYAPMTFDIRHPIILPQNSHFTELIIRQYHVEVGHSGASHTWAALRQKYWIVKGSTAVRKSLGKCILCKRRNALVGKQLMADVPDCRL